MPFEEDGFLAPEMAEWIRQHRTDHRVLVRWRSFRMSATGHHPAHIENPTRAPGPKAASANTRAADDPGRMRTAACEYDAPARCRRL